MTAPDPVSDDALQRLMGLLHSNAAPGGALLAGRYEVRERVGQGGMGDVYRGWDQRLQRTVAIKLVRNERAYDEEFRVRFEREAKALAALSHPNILSVHDFGREQDLLYLVTEFVDGTTLFDALQRQRPSVPETLRIVSQICEALRHAHRVGIVHRDIKPANILIARDGWIKVADFGLARFLPNYGSGEPTRMTVPGAALGTPIYMAPEQRDPRADVDQRADVYSLGVVLYELLTGDLPVGKFDPPSTKSSSDPRLDSTVLRALEADPARRFQSVEDLQADLRRNTEGTAAPHRKSRRGILVGVVLVVSAIAVGGWIFRDRFRSTPSAAPVAATPPESTVKLEDVRWDPADLPAGWSEASVDEGYSDLPLPLFGRDDETLSRFFQSARALPNVEATGVYCAAFRRAGNPEIYLTVVELRDPARGKELEREKRLHPSAPKFRKVRTMQSGRLFALWGLTASVEGAFERFVQRYRVRFGLPSITWESLVPSVDDRRLPKPKAEDRDAGRILKDVGLAGVDPARITHAYRATYHPEGELLILETADDATLVRLEHRLAERGHVVLRGCWVGCVASEDDARRKILEEFLSSKLGPE